jgi:hypothetical protein
VTVLALRVYVFACNESGCDEDTGEIVPSSEADGARSAWRVAKAEGWTRAAADRHFCPRHRDRLRGVTADFARRTLSMP